MEEQHSTNVTWQDKKPVAAMKPVNKITQSTGVWTLVPKELLESEFFKKHVVRMQLPNQRGKTIRRVRSVVIRPPYSPRSAVTHQVSQPQRMEMRYPGRPLQVQPVVWPKSQQKCSSRPTVIYFNELKNDLKVETREERKGNEVPQLAHTEEFNKQRNLHYLYSKYPDVNRMALNYVHDVSGGNLNETEHLLAQMLSGKQLFVPQQDGYPRMIGSQNLGPGLSVKVVDQNSNENAYGPEICPSFSSSMFSSPTNDLDATTRCLIVESMKILYDSEAVLG